MLTGLLKAAIGLYKEVSGGFNFQNIIGFVLTNLAPAISKFVDGFLGTGKAKARIDDALQAYDDYTGSDPDAIVLFSTLPRDKAEAMHDHIKEVARIMAYNQIKEPGYYVENDGGPKSGV